MEIQCELAFKIIKHMAYGYSTINHMLQAKGGLQTIKIGDNTLKDRIKTPEC